MLCSELPPRIYESLKTLCCLAKAPGALQAHEIASMAKLPPAQTAKVLQALTWAGFLVSRRGTRGGFWLAQPADKIHVPDVITSLTHKTRDRAEREQDGVTKVLARALARCKRDFGQITLADLARAAKYTTRHGARNAESQKSKAGARHEPVRRL